MPHKTALILHVFAREEPYRELEAGSLLLLETRWQRSSLTNPSVWEGQPLASPTMAPLSLPLGAADSSPSVGHPAQELRVLNCGH